MAAPISDEAADRAKLARLVHDAVAKGQAAIAAGDRVEAVRWLDRAHRLAPSDPAVTLWLASAATSLDNPRAATLFEEVLKAADPGDAWFGLASSRFLMNDVPGARLALTELLSRFAWRPEAAGLIEQVARMTDAPGWCGLTGDGVLVVNPFCQVPVIRMDGSLIEGCTLPPDWTRARQLTVVTDDLHLMGSPISPGAIGKVEGFVEASFTGIQGWAWCPGDPDANPRLSIGTGRWRTAITASALADTIPHRPPFARPRFFSAAWADLPNGDSSIPVRGQDGRHLRGSPIIRSRSIASSADRLSRAKRAPSSQQRPGKPGWQDDGRAAAILLTHDDGGGVELRVKAAAASQEALGRRAMILRPAPRQKGKAGVVVVGGPPPHPVFELPRHQSDLQCLLRASRPAEIELHHFLNHDPSVFQVIRDLNVPYDIHIHDYSWFCPRIALVGHGDRYCGEPDVSVCTNCVSTLGSYLNDDISVAGLIERSHELLRGARRVVAPSSDAAARMMRHFPGLRIEIVPHEDDNAIDEPPPIPTTEGTVTVCVAGAIGLHKGFDIVLACAHDARLRGLDLNFIVAGTTIDDQRLMDTGRVFVTGPYEPTEAVALIRSQHAALALLPSIWPETWCLTLAELWRAGLRVAAFDIGTQAERIRATGRGFLFPLDFPPPSINDMLLNAASGRSFLSI